MTSSQRAVRNRSLSPAQYQDAAVFIEMATLIVLSLRLDIQHAGTKKGTLGMEERIDQLGRLFDIESELGRMTVLSIRLSLSVPEPAMSRKVA